MVTEHSGSKWEKPSRELLQRFDEIMRAFPYTERRKMFGFPCAFVKGNMFTGLHQQSMFMRLSPDDRETFLELENAHLFQPMPDRTMKEYVVIPQSILNSDEELNRWLEKSIQYANSLPPKQPKKGTRKKKK